MRPRFIEWERAVVLIAERRNWTRLDAAEALVVEIRSGNVEVRDSQDLSALPPTDWSWRGAILDTGAWMRMLVNQADIDRVFPPSAPVLQLVESGRKPRNFSIPLCDAVRSCSDLRPGQEMPWGAFCVRVREAGGVSDKARGWNDKTIERCYRAMFQSGPTPTD